MTHVVACIEQDAAAVAASQPPPPPSAPSSPAGSSSDGEPDMEEAKYHLARMIALRGYDPSIVDDDCFRDFVESLNPEFRVPSRADIEELCDVTFRGAYLYSGSKVNGARGRISLAVGKATILEREVVYTAFHFIDHEWNLHRVIVDAEIKTACVESHLDIGAKMMTSTFCWMRDHEAANNLFMMAWGITDDHSKLKGYISQTFPHSYALEKTLVQTTFMDSILHSIAEHLYLQIDANFIGDVYKYIVVLGKQDYENLFVHVGVDLWAQKEAWYSWYCSLLIIRKDLSGTNLEFTKLLCKIWGEIYRAIKIISASSCPTSNLCLLELYNVWKILRSEEAQARGHTNLYSEGCTGFTDNKDFATVLEGLRDILEKAIKDSLLVLSIPLVLDPRYKLHWVISIFIEVFGEDAGGYISKLTEFMYSAYVNKLDENQRANAQEDFDRYLDVPVAHSTKSFDILDWWKVHGSHYPTVALMARDALAMPTSSQLSSEQIAHVKSSLRGYW